MSVYSWTSSQKNIRERVTNHHQLHLTSNKPSRGGRAGGEIATH
ncbi:MAG: hypothetical protein K0R47_5536 [Brevibacillus sp.]|nr:hypothetical protein [Brevibacillus sp.]